MAEVEIYTRMMCGYCAAAKRLLENKGVAYVEHDASFSPELRQEMTAKANGGSTFPQIFINGTHVGGSDDLHALERSGKLDALLAGGLVVTVMVAALQMRSTQDPARNIADFETLVREAAAAGAAYVQSPEMTGALVRNRETLRSIITSEDKDALVRRAGELARELGIYVHVGSTAIARDDGKVANRAFVFGPDGAVLATYDKIHMFDVDLDNGESWRESATYEPGRSTMLVDLPFGPIGLSVCYDLRFPQLFRAQALAGAVVMTVPAAFTRQTGEAHWHVLLRARAIENGAFVIAAAQGGRHEDGRETFGHSMIVDPWGRILAEAEGDEPGIVLAEIDPEASAAARGKVPNLKNACEFEVAHAACAQQRAAAS